MTKSNANLVKIRIGSSILILFLDFSKACITFSCIFGDLNRAYILSKVGY